MSTPIIAMITPTTSSLRSGVSESHHETETGAGGDDPRPFFEVCVDLPFPRGVTVLPFDFAPDFGAVNGTFNGIFVV